MGKKITYLIICLLLLCGVCLAFRMQQHEVQGLLIRPVVQVVSILSGSTAACTQDNSYFFSSLNITIDVSCAGSNFLMLCFLLISALMFKQSASRYYFMFPLISLITAALSTPLVNTLRILAATAIQHLSNLFLPPRPHYLIHQTTGILVNLMVLYLIYYFVSHSIKHLHTKTGNYALPA
jgi:exosortase K